MSKFLDRIIERAKTDKKTIVLAEGEEIRTIAAASVILANGISDVILLGNKDKINGLAKGYDISSAKIIEPCSADNFEAFADNFYELRKDKGMTEEKARELMRDTIYYGSMMIKEGTADGMVAGAVHSTADVLRPNLQILKPAPGMRLVSSFFIMVVPDCEYGEYGAFIFADSGLVENPNADMLCEIAISSAASFEKLLEKQACVAMLSYSTYGSAKGELVEKMRTATQKVKNKAPNLKIDGELQADAAIIPHIGKSKAPGSEIAGSANVLIFPDLNSGNIAYKLVERLAKAEAYGPITQGMAKPVNDLSRGCSAEDIVGVAAITCVQAQNK